VSDTSQSKDDSKYLFDMVNERYGDRLTPEELEEVKKGIEAIRKTADTLRMVKLENSDEPFALFVPHREES
jgi:hypothetical protein